MHRPTPVLYRIVESFFRYKLRFLLAFFVVSLTVALVLYTRSRTYTAQSLVRVITNTQATEVMGIKTRSWTAPSQKNINAFNDLMNDDAPNGFVDNALKAADLNPPIKVDGDAKDPRYVKLRKSLYTAVKSEEVFAIGIKWENPDEAERIVNAFQKAFIEERGDSQRIDSINTARFLDEQIRKMKGRLKEAEDAVTQFKQKNMGRLSDAMTSEMQQLNQFETELRYLQITAESNALRRKSLEEQLAKTPPKTVLEATYQQTQSPAGIRLEQLKKERSDLMARGYLPTSSKVQYIEGQIIRAQQEYNQELREMAEQRRREGASGKALTTTVQDNPAYLQLQQQLNEARITEQTQASQRRELQRKIAEYRKRIGEIPAAERELTERTREYDVLQKRYADMLDRREGAKLKGELQKLTEVSKLQPIGLVRAESTAGTLKTLIMMAGAILVGLVVACGTLIVSELLDPSLRYPSDAERILGVPVLAFLPEARDLRLTLSLPAPDDPYSNTGEGQPALSAAS